MKDRAQDLWQEIGNELGDDVVDDMSWDEFSTRFQAEFAPAIEVQQLVREFLDLLLVTEIVAEITFNF